MKKSHAIETALKKKEKDRTPEDKKKLEDFLAENLDRVKRIEAVKTADLDFKAMERVCADADETEWVYANGVYYRIRDGRIADNILVGRIRGQYLTDPFQKWEEKCRIAGTNTGTDEGRKRRPSNAVFKLWDHWLIKSSGGA